MIETESNAVAFKDTTEERSQMEIPVGESDKIRDLSEKETTPISEGERRYETLMILPARYEGKALDEIIPEIKKIFENASAKIHRIENLGRRTLAYPILKQTEGVYVNVIFDSNPASIKLLDRELKLNQTIMRFLTTVIARSKGRRR